MTRPDVIVVGGGVVGSAVAWSLARRGVAVRLLERDSVAAHASGAAAGMLAPISEAAPDTALRRAALAALEVFPGVVEELESTSGVDPEWVQSGVLRVAHDASAAVGLRARAERDAEHGVVWLEGAEARAAAPGLAETCPGATWSPREAHVRSPLLTEAFVRSAEARGAQIEAGVPVTGLTIEAGRVRGVETAAGRLAAGGVVLCAGCWTTAATAWAGARVPVEPVRGQIVSLDAPSPPFAPIVWGADTYLVPKRDGSVVVGATEERAGFEVRVTAEGVGTLLEAATSLVPPLAKSGFRGAWAGLRPAAPDRLPVVGALPAVEGCWVASGHHRNGVLLSPVTAEWIADEVEGKGVASLAAPFDPARFAA